MATLTEATAAAVFDTREQADFAADELRRAGFGDEQIGVAVRAGDVVPASQHVAAGAALGMLGGLALAAGSLTPAAPVLVGGALAGMLAGGAAGAAVGGLAGIGLSDDEARLYEAEVAAGRTLVTVRADERYDEAVTILRRCGGRGPTCGEPGLPPIILF